MKYGGCLLLSAIICVVALAGCGKTKHGTTPVAGQITFGGGPCPAQGSVMFSPLDVPKDQPRRVGFAPFGTDGKFTVTSFSKGDGLLPGKYRVKIDCWKKLPEDLEPGVSHVPDGFQPPDVTIEAGKPAVVNIDVPAAAK